MDIIFLRRGKLMKDSKSVYQEEYEKLNKKQKQAVDTVEGPVMVIAGPGTGKTQILSRRVANILTNYNTKGFYSQSSEKPYF